MLHRSADDSGVNRNIQIVGLGERSWWTRQSAFHAHEEFDHGVRAKRDNGVLETKDNIMYSLKRAVGYQRDNPVWIAQQ
jgi:hypothetical protein